MFGTIFNIIAQYQLFTQISHFMNFKQNFRNSVGTIQLNRIDRTQLKNKILVDMIYDAI